MQPQVFEIPREHLHWAAKSLFREKTPSISPLLEPAVFRDTACIFLSVTAEVHAFFFFLEKQKLYPTMGGGLF